MSQQINLYDPALKKKTDWLSLGNVVVAALLLAIGVGAAGYAARVDLPTLKGQVEAMENQLKAMRDQIALLGQKVATRKSDPVLERELESTRQQAATQAEVASLLRQRLGPEPVSYAEYLRGFARQSVSGLWLTGFSYDMASGGMEISGRTVDPALLPQYIQRLSREQVFQGRAFASLNLAVGEENSANASSGGASVAGASSPSLGGTAKKAPYHEFKLVPRKATGTETADKAAKLSQGQSPPGRQG